MMDVPMPTLPLGIKEITRYISHRYPFLFVDKILTYIPNETIHGIKNISASDPIVAGYLPEMIVLEGLAQTSGVLGSLSTSRDCKTHILIEMKNVQFKRQALQGDTIHYHIVYKKRRGNFIWFTGEARVDGRLLVKADFSAKVT